MTFLLRARMQCYGKCRRSRSGKKQIFPHGNVEVRVAGVTSEGEARKLVRGFINSRVCPTDETRETLANIKLISGDVDHAEESSVTIIRGKGDALRFNPVVQRSPAPKF